MENMIQVGTNKESVTEIKIAIMEILTVSSCDELTKQTALKTLSDGVRIDNVVIESCSFVGNKEY